MKKRRSLVVDQATLTAKVEKEVVRVMAELNRRWYCKPQMPPSQPGAGYNYVPYRMPSIKQLKIHLEFGVAAFVTEEQIDHRLSDPQIRHELYVLTAGSERVQSMAEDHGYEERQGGAFLTILEIGAESIVINTKRGKATLVLR